MIQKKKNIIFTRINNIYNEKKKKYSNFEKEKFFKHFTHCKYRSNDLRR